MAPRPPSSSSRRSGPRGASSGGSGQRSGGSSRPPAGRSGSGPRRSGSGGGSGSGSGGAAGSTRSTGGAPGGAAGKRRSGPGGSSSRPGSGRPPGKGGAGRSSGGGERRGRDDDRRGGRPADRGGREERIETPPPKGWGKLARKGAARVDDPEATTAASGAWRSAMQSAKPPVRRNMGPTGNRPPAARGRGPERPDERPAPRGPAPAKAPEAWEPEEWILEPDLAAEAAEAVERGRKPGRRGTVPVPEAEIEADVRAELARAVGATKVAKFEVRLRDATRAFEAERFSDAARMLKKLADDAPSAAAVRELYGLTLYRQGKWRQAAHELEAFHLLTDSTEQHPVLADCYRALHNYGKVAELWAELKAASPGAELVTEGRIVAAGALADQGDNKGAVQLLEQGFSFPKRPREHHLRRAYALADCYERAGDVIRARELFTRISVVDPSFADARRRARALR